MPDFNNFERSRAHVGLVP